MKAIFLDGAKNLVEGSAADPSPGRGEVMIKVHTMGVCGSDIEYYLHNRIGSFVPQAPLVLGHEFSGEVVAQGPGVTTPAIGTRVAVDPSIPCRLCEYCRSGRHNLCTNLKFIGTAATVPHIPGGLAEYVVLPAVNCYAIADHLSWGEGACLEPLSVAVHAALRPGTIAGKTVLISGGGTIGQFLALVVRAFGASIVAVSDLQPFRLRFARDRGADIAIDVGDPSSLAEAQKQTGGFNLIFEASGAPPAVRANLEIVKKGGTIVQVGSIANDIELPANLIMSKELRYMGSMRYGDIYPISMNLMTTRRVDVRPLISETFPMAQVASAFELAAERGNTIKVQVENRL